MSAATTPEIAPRQPPIRSLALLAASMALATAGCEPVRGLAGQSPPPTAGGSSPTLVTALGRLEPRDSIREVAAPSSRPSAVIARLLIDEGDRVATGQPIAELDTLTEDAARLTRAQAELKNAEAELARIEKLLTQQLTADETRDKAQLRVDVARADVAVAQATLDLSTVRSPVTGEVIDVHTRQGERVGAKGIAEIAQNDQMYAVAEVYETDIGRVRVGQRATVRSPALEKELTGAVDRIGRKIGKLDILADDPVASADARVVEVRIKLDDSARAAGLSNLQVEVAIQTAAP